MDAERPLSNPPSNRPSGAEHRRSSRFPVVVPLEVNWREANGREFTEETKAEEVNAHGALLRMNRYPSAGLTAQLKNLSTGETTEAKVAAIRRTRAGAIQGVAVELLRPSDTFWGLNFELRRASAELFRLERGIQSGDLDPLILRDFRDAVDYVRKTAWAVQEWRERQIQKRDPSTVLSLLTLERIRRATTLVRDLLGDLQTQHVSKDTEGITELNRAIDELRHLLHDF